MILAFAYSSSPRSVYSHALLRITWPLLRNNVLTAPLHYSFDSNNAPRHHNRKSPLANDYKHAFAQSRLSSETRDLLDYNAIVWYVVFPSHLLQTTCMKQCLHSWLCFLKAWATNADSCTHANQGHGRYPMCKTVILWLVQLKIPYSHNTVEIMRHKRCCDRTNTIALSATSATSSQATSERVPS